MLSFNIDTEFNEMIQLNPISFDTLFPQWVSALESTHILDLSGLGFVVPGGLLFLFFGLLEALRKLPYARLIIPRLHKLRGYLARIGFFHQLPVSVCVEPALESYEREIPLVYHGNSISVFELTRIDTRQTLRGLIGKVSDTSQEYLGYDEEKAHDLETFISELGDNALRHADAKHVYSLMQGYGQGSDRRLELGIGDDGMGVAQSLSQAHDYNFVGQDAEALTVAVKPRVSCLIDSDPFRGNGLADVVTKTYDNSGTLNIRSGSARYRHRGEARWIFDVPRLRGTQVVISLPVTPI